MPVVVKKSKKVAEHCKARQRMGAMGSEILCPAVGRNSKLPKERMVNVHTKFFGALNTASRLSPDYLRTFERRKLTLFESITFSRESRSLLRYHSNSFHLSIEI